MKRRTTLPGPADLIAPAVPCVLSLNAREAPQLLKKTGSDETEIIRSAIDVREGFNIGPIGYGAASLQPLRDFRDNPPVINAQLVAYIDDIITVMLPAPEAKNPAAVAEVATWLQTHMEPVGIELNRKKPQILLPPGTEV